MAGETRGKALDHGKTFEGVLGKDLMPRPDPDVRLP